MNKRLKWCVPYILFLAIVFWSADQAPATAAPLTAQTTRLFGQTRIETAIQISQTGWQHADTVLLARADDFPDSLVAVPLSRRLDAPILLTYPQNLDQGVLTELKRLGAQHVVLLGGAGVLGQAITQPLEKAGIKWERIGGVDRYATAVAVAERMGANGQVILASGENFPDAMAVGPYAGYTETPILLTSAKEVPAVTKAEINKLAGTGTEDRGEGVARVLVIGGEGVIPTKTLQGIAAIKRISGVDRYETAAKVYWFAQEELADHTVAGPNFAYLVTGENFPDALVAGALAVKRGALLFMSHPTELPAMTYSAMGNASSNGLIVTLIGGAGVLSDQVKGTVEGTIQPPYLLGGMTVVLDPGHGGIDSGAIGASGAFEKDYNLSVALELADILRAAGAKVVLTRAGDYLPSGVSYTEKSDLATRVDIAEKNKADLFVSIHYNSAATPDAYGTETYYSSNNSAAAGSLKLAQAVQAEIVKALAVYKRGDKEDRGIKDRNYRVIADTTMPAVLVEVGFISNPSEEKLIAGPDFASRAALGIYRGILVYKGY